MYSVQLEAKNWYVLELDLADYTWLNAPRHVIGVTRLRPVVYSWDPLSLVAGFIYTGIHDARPLLHYLMQVCDTYTTPFFNPQHHGMSHRVLPLNTTGDEAPGERRGRHASARYPPWVRLCVDVLHGEEGLRRPGGVLSQADGALAAGER